MAYKKTKVDRPDRNKEILEKLEAGVSEFFETDKITNYLDVMSKFHQYSFNNQVLIAKQNPRASFVAGFKSWQKNFERYVKKGEEGIYILAPLTKKFKVETDKIDKNGNKIVDEIEKILFRPVAVFDLSQTEGKDFPSFLDNLIGDVENYKYMVEGVKLASPFPIKIEKYDDISLGYCSFSEKLIVVQDEMSEVQTLKTMVHEVAHARVHEGAKEKTREQKEVEAESIAYVVLNHFGIDTSDYSFGYVATWGSENKDDLEILKGCMKTISEESNKIIDIVSKNYKERTEKIEDLEVQEIEDQVTDVLKEALSEIGEGGKAIGSMVYGTEKNEDGETVVKVLAEYEGSEREDYLFDTINENKVKMGNIVLDINPITAPKSGTRAEYYQEEKRLSKPNDSWPMITITYSSNKDVMVGRYNIFKVKTLYDEISNKNSAEELKGDYLKINISYVYEGYEKERTDTVRFEEGRKNFIDYLNVPVPVATYLNRHSQLIETIYNSKNKDAISPGTPAQEEYEDMILEWAEEMRRELNYNINPSIVKPPLFIEGIEQHKEWEVAR